MSIDQKIGQIIQLDVEGITDNEKTNPQKNLKKVLNRALDFMKSNQKGFLNRFKEDFNKFKVPFTFVSTNIDGESIEYLKSNYPKLEGNILHADFLKLREYLQILI